MKRSVLAFTVLAALATPTLAGQTEILKLFVPSITGCPSCPYIAQIGRAHVSTPLTSRPQMPSYA